MLFNVDKALSLPDIRHIVAKRDEVLARFGPIFRDPQSLTKQDYLDFLSFKHNHHWTGLERLGRCQRRSKIGPRGGAKLSHFGLARKACGGRRPVSRAPQIAGG
jgi:hypothetical protein